MRRIDELHLEFPIAWRSAVARLAGCRGGARSAPSACHDADEADGDRRALSPSPHDKPEPGHKV
jgi:hypothetical protein